MEIKYNRECRQIIGLSGGKDSTATAILLKDKIPNLEYVFCDTGAELKETYEYLDKLENYLGKPIVRLNAGHTFMDILEENGGFLPSPMARWCTRQLKIKPFEEYIGNDWAESYIGIRYDEVRKGYLQKNSNICPRYPLIEQRIDLAGVNKILKESGVGKPTYYEWRTRSGCYFCFYQRQIEWVGLMEKHPDLFQRAKEIEKKYGKDKFTWIKGHKLDMIERRRDIIKDKFKRKMQRQKEKEKKAEQEDIATRVVNKEGDIDHCVHCHL